LRLENEIAVGYSLIGPHRDELEILIDGQEVSKFGSSGEQRSALITLDLAQIAIYHQTFEEYPIFLIDDIDAELDLKRISLLLDHLANKMQVFISTSKREIASQYQKKAQCNFISQGKIIENTSENIFEIVENIFEKQIFENNEIITKTTDLSVNNLVENKENLQIESVKTSASNNVFLVKEDFKEEPSIDEEDRHRAPF
ncbi:MAG: DNA replication/repair protein RecF, partial [Blastocatellia bacterium]|nr:DNA replication/repair protein RecF [Blastocatellia bacterium]